ncbi:MAG: CAP domain-containing protein [Nanoarchaeota archaeon]|nr:CAP domain-containing protein [Nanoarchaeota archaeon]
MYRKKGFLVIIPTSRIIPLLVIGSIFLVGIYFLDFDDISTESYKDETNSFESNIQCEDINVEELELLIHRKVRVERKNAKLNMLKWDEELNQIARKYSDYMAKNKHFEHEDLEGNRFDYRYKQANYYCSVPIDTIYYPEETEIEEGEYGIYEITTQQYETYLSEGAENLALDYYDITRELIVVGATHSHPCTMGEVAENIVNGWMSSPGHRENILTPHHRNHGIGVSVLESSEGNWYDIYVTQNFC